MSEVDWMDVGREPPDYRDQKEPPDLWLDFPDSILVRPRFPFGGASWRFSARLKDQKDAQVSVYLDVDGSLGVYGSLKDPEPYWEVHPGPEGGCERVAAGKVETLMQVVLSSLRA